MASLALGGVAFADVVENDIDAVGDRTIPAGGSTTIGYKIQVQGQGLDGEGGCNASEASPATVTLSVPVGVTASRTSLRFTSCGTFQYVDFGAAAIGTYPVTIASVTDSGPGTYAAGPANFALVVTAAANTAPEVAVTGVADGATYRRSEVPQPGCHVVDAEDVGESATAQVSNGAFDALGSHTVTCSYTDGGAINRSATATYTVVRDRDTTAPSVGYTLDPATPDGDNGWYTGDVSLTWSVDEGESPETLIRTGCLDRTITDDQAATTYLCSATSEGGTASDSATIKRDSEGPQVSYDSVLRGVEGSNGWYTSPVTVTFAATDTLSGPVSATQTVTTSEDGEAVTVESPAFTDAAGNTTAAGDQTSPAFKIDTQAPNAPTYTLGEAANELGWHNDAVLVDFSAAGDNGPSGGVTCSDDVWVADDGTDQIASSRCTDAAGNVGPETRVSINLDSTVPTVSETVEVAGTKGTNGWYRSNVAVTFSATDALSGLASASQTVVSSGEGAAVQVASPVFTDNAGNSTEEGVVTGTYKIDWTAPATPTFQGGPGASYTFGNDPARPTCSSSDAVSGIASCVVTGGGSTVGEHTYTATATDEAGNSSTATHTYRVLPWTTKGYFSPVDMNGVWNTVKGGSTVPLKFEVFAGATELTSTTAVKTFVAKAVACPLASAPVDEIETVLTGSTSLRYDSTGGQFIQNWQTPKRPDTCAQAITVMQDGSAITANFKFK